MVFVSFKAILVTSPVFLVVWLLVLFLAAILPSGFLFIYKSHFQEQGHAVNRAVSAEWCCTDYLQAHSRVRWCCFLRDPVPWCPFPCGERRRQELHDPTYATLRSRLMLFVASFRRLKRSMRSSFHSDGSVDSLRTPTPGRTRATPSHSFKKPRLRK